MKRNGFSVIPDGVSVDGSYLALPARVYVADGALTVRSFFSRKTRVVELSRAIITEEHDGVFGIREDDTLRLRDGTNDIRVHFMRRFKSRRRYESFVAAVRENGGAI